MSHYLTDVAKHLCYSQFWSQKTLPINITYDILKLFYKKIMFFMLIINIAQCS